MRITGGILGGRKISTPKSGDIRPTTDKIRLAIFNMLNSRLLVNNANVLDAFCGTGALGVESFSHGAKEVCFVDKDVRAVNLAKENADLFDLKESSYFLKRDSVKGFEKPQAMGHFDLVFLDPPYNRGLIVPTINNLISSGSVKDVFHVVAETERDADINQIITEIKSDVELIIDKNYGTIKVSIMKISLFVD